MSRCRCAVRPLLAGGWRLGLPLGTAGCWRGTTASGGSGGGKRNTRLGIIDRKSECLGCREEDATPIHEVAGCCGCAEGVQVIQTAVARDDVIMISGVLVAVVVGVGEARRGLGFASSRCVQ
jgi:hypothetical protein